MSKRVAGQLLGLDDCECDKRDGWGHVVSRVGVWVLPGQMAIWYYLGEGLKGREDAGYGYGT